MKIKYIKINAVNEFHEMFFLVMLKKKIAGPVSAISGVHTWSMDFEYTFFLNSILFANYLKWYC